MARGPGPGRLPSPAATHRAARGPAAVTGLLWGAALALAAPVGAQAPAPPASAEAPCTWHVRLVYHYREAGLQGARDTQLQLGLETPLACTGAGAQLTLPRHAGPGIAWGRAHLTGNVPHPGGPATLRDTYDKFLAWPTADAASQPAIEVPAPSFVGAGHATRITVAGVPVGTQHSGVVDADAPARDAAGDRRALHAAVDPVGTADRLDLDLYFDPVPGTPADPTGAIAQIPQRTAEALKAPGGEAALALKGHLFGAQTLERDDGAFSIRYQRHLVLAPATLDVDFCGWLTRAGQAWVPDHLPAVDPAPAP